MTRFFPVHLHPIDSLSRTYTAYFAVVSRQRSVPPTFKLIYQNDQFMLYWIDK